jgi:hypothetical protein
MSKETNIDDAGEILIVYNICYIVLGFVLVGIAPLFDIQFSISVIIVSILILLCNKIHLMPYWLTVFRKS